MERKNQDKQPDSSNKKVAAGTPAAQASLTDQPNNGMATQDENAGALFSLQNDMTINTVQVRLLDLGWLYANDKVFLDFIAIL